MLTSSAKAKGRKLCQKVKEILLKWSPDLKPDDIIVTSSGDTGEDLKLSPHAREIYPYSIECKNQEKINIWESYEQAKTHSQDKPYIPLLVYSRNRSETMVTLSLEDFMKLTR
jgi:hypothetical protein